MAKGLVWGNGAILTGPTKPTNGQAICNNNGVLGGCAGGGAGSCNGTVTLLNGVGLFVNSCVTVNTTICLGRDTVPTHFTSPVIFPQPPANGSITLTGTGNDTVQVTCVQ